MTTAHKVTLFGIVLNRLQPYQNRMKPNHDLWIRFDSFGHKRDNIEVAAHRWKNGAIADAKWFTYRLDGGDEININSFIDSVIEGIKPFLN